MTIGPGGGGEATPQSAMPVSNDHPDLANIRHSSAAQLIRAIPLEQLIRTGSGKTVDVIKERVEVRAKRIESVEEDISNGTILGDELSLATPIAPFMLESSGRNRFARSFMEETYRALGENFSLDEPNFDPGSALPDIMNKLGRTADLNSNGFQRDNLVRVNLRPNANEWQDIILYDPLPKAETMTAQNGDQWKLARTTHIIKTSPTDKLVQYGLSYVRLPVQK